MDKLIKNKCTITVALLIVAIYTLLMNLIPKNNNLYVFSFHLISTIFVMILVAISLTINKKLRNSNKKLQNILKINSAMLDISEIAITTEDANDVLDFILEKAIGVIGKSTKGSILILKDKEYLEFIASKGFSDHHLENSKLKLKDTFLWVKSNGNVRKPVVIDIDDYYSQRGIDELKKVFDAANMEEIKSTISAPILVDDNLYGMLNLDSEEYDAYTQEDVKSIEGFTNMVGIILKNHQLLKKTIYQSKYDKLTNIYNRHSFEEMFQDLIFKANRYQSNFSMVVIDIDSLKYVNDIHGHLAGDEVLRLFTNTIKEHIRCSDVFARYGGDEFITVFFNTKKEDIVNKFDEVKKYLNDNPIIVDDKKIICRFSYGISRYPEDGKNHNELIEIADRRMYINKKNKNKSCTK